MERTEEMIAADAEIDEGFHITRDELKASRERDADSAVEALDNRQRARLLTDRKYQREYYQRHQEALKAQHRAYYDEHREKINQKRRGKRQTEYEQLYQKAYYEENREIILVKKQIQSALNRAYRHLLEAEGEA